jgi:hypothetical protein
MPPPKPRVHRGERNIHGDFVITKINVKVRELELKRNLQKRKRRVHQRNLKKRSPLRLSLWRK